MGPLTAIIPFPRRVRLGDRDFRVGELRLLDLAELQACLDETQPDTLGELFLKLDDADEQTRRELLADAWERVIEQGPPTIWDERGARWLLTVEGLSTLILIALRRWHPLETAECIELARQVDWHQYAALRRALFGSKPLKVLERLLGLESESPGGPDIKWPQAIAEVAQSYHLPLEAVYRCTLTEFAVLRTGGKPADSEEGRPIEEGEDLATAMREQYKRFHGHYPPEESEAIGAGQQGTGRPDALTE
jgi:hypothetical protein